MLTFFGRVCFPWRLSIERPQVQRRADHEDFQATRGDGGQHSLEAHRHIKLVT